MRRRLATLVLWQALLVAALGALALTGGTRVQAWPFFLDLTPGWWARSSALTATTHPPVQSP